MRQIKLSKKLAIISVVIISIIFLAIISPLKGLSILTWPLILLGIGLWVTSVIQLIAGLSQGEWESEQKISITIALLFIIGFIPLGLVLMNISGDVSTKITVNIINGSDFSPNNILIYGEGNIFENPDTLRLKSFNKGEKIAYILYPTTKPHRSGFIRMEFDIDNQHRSKVIAGEFSVNPYKLQQDWEVIMDNEFVK